MVVLTKRKKVSNVRANYKSNTKKNMKGGAMSMKNSKSRGPHASYKGPSMIQPVEIHPLSKNQSQQPSVSNPSRRSVKIIQSKLSKNTDPLAPDAKTGVALHPRELPQSLRNQLAMQRKRNTEMSESGVVTKYGVPNVLATAEINTSPNKITYPNAYNWPQGVTSTGSVTAVGSDNRLGQFRFVNKNVRSAQSVLPDIKASSVIPLNTPQITSEKPTEEIGPFGFVNPNAQTIIHTAIPVVVNPTALNVLKAIPVTSSQPIVLPTPTPPTLPTPQLASNIPTSGNKILLPQIKDLTSDPGPRPTNDRGLYPKTDVKRSLLYKLYHGTKKLVQKAAPKVFGKYQSKTRATPEEYNAMGIQNKALRDILGPKITKGQFNWHKKGNEIIASQKQWTKEQPVRNTEVLEARRAKFAKEDAENVNISKIENPEKRAKAQTEIQRQRQQERAKEAEANAKRKEEYIQQSKTKTALRLQQIRKQENNENILIPNKKKREQAQAERKAKRIQENTQTKEIENKIMANQKTRRESLKNILKEVEA